MATKTFSGTLSQAMDSLAAEGNKIIFVPQQTVGDVLTGASSIMAVESDGSYSVDLSYNTYSIYHYSDISKRKIKIGDNIVVASDTTAETLSDLISSATGELTSDEVLAIQGYLEDAETYATEAADSYTDTLALFDDFDDNVLDVVGEIHTDTPALSIPFNESGRLDYGVGSTYVSGLPVYRVYFDRNSEISYVGKSGGIETAEDDELAIGVDGAWFHSAYTNYVRLSNSIYTLSTSGANLTETTDDYLFGTSSTLFVEANVDSEHFVNLRATTFSSDYINQSIFVKAATNPGTRNFSLRFYGENTGTNLFEVDTDGVITTTDEQSSVEYVGNGWYRCSAYQELTGDGSANTGTRFQIRDSVEGNSFQGDGETSFYIDGAQVTESTACLPLVMTNGDDGNASKTTCTVFGDGNLPVAGSSFTVRVDIPVILSDGINYNVLFSTNTFSQDEGFRAQIRPTDSALLFMGSNGSSTETAAVTSTTLDDYLGLTTRFAFVYDADSLTLTIYADGDYLASKTMSSTIVYDPTENIRLGENLNSQLKNFNLYHYAADAAEVASWGGAK